MVAALTLRAWCAGPRGWLDDTGWTGDIVRGQTNGRPGDLTECEVEIK